METQELKVESQEIKNETNVDSNNSEATSEIKNKKKLDKLIENILKKNTLKQTNTFEEKYYILVQSFLDLNEKQKKTELNVKEQEKTMLNYKKQHDQMQNEVNKAMLAKDKLESLCRELQKHNKQIKEENVNRLKEEEERRKEISGKFQSAIDEINEQVKGNTEKNSTLITENAQLAAKLKNLLEQYEVREQQIDKILKHKDLEVQLANAKLQQSELKCTEQTEKNKIYESHCVELTKKCQMHQEAEKQLRQELKTYTEKYEEFQSTLKKSNQAFETFKSEMNKMTKKLHKLEEETTMWRGKWENCDKTLQKVVNQKNDLENHLKKAQTKADLMEKLSRSLQDERNTLKEELKKLNINEKESIVEEVDTKLNVEPILSDQEKPSEEQPQSTEN